MIPRKLELKNFLSYGDSIQVIDFTKHSLICLSGKNGHGKSALLDALTWGLWGQARKLSGAQKADDGLLRLGQTRMMVSLEFEFEQHIYRVRREFAKTYGKSFSALDFDIFDENADKFQPLSDKTIKLTQLKIDTLLGLDFDTFSNSAFLRQGQANEFSKKTAKERKQIIANILGLSKYDQLQHLALEQVRNLADEKRLLAHTNEQQLQEIAKEAEIASTLLEQQKDLESTTKHLETLNSQAQIFEKQWHAFELEKKYFEQLSSDFDATTKDIEQKKYELKSFVSEWKRVHVKMLQLPDTKELETQRQKLHEQERALLTQQKNELEIRANILHKKESFQKEKLELSAALEKGLNALRIDQQTKEFEQKHLEQILVLKNRTSVDFNAKLRALETEEAALKKQLILAVDFETNFQTTKNQFEKRRSFYQVLVQRGNSIKNELTELEEKQKIVQDQTSPACPMCDQVLTLKRKQFLATKFIKHDAFLRHKLTRIGSIIKRLKELLLVQHQNIEQLNKQADLLKQHQIKAQDVAVKIEEAKKEVALLATEITQIQKQQIELNETTTKARALLLSEEKSISDKIQNDARLLLLQTEITQLEKEQQLLSGHLTEYSKLQQQIQKLDQAFKEISLLKNEQEEQPIHRQKIAYLIQIVKSQKIKSIELNKQLENLKTNKSLEIQLTLQRNTIAAEMTKIAAQKDLILQATARLQHELDRIQKLKTQSEQIGVQVKKIDNEIEDYSLLGNAFGKNGIQALLIEQAIPEIEQEANILLSRLTENQAQIFIESLKDLKGGGVKETLDIQISDSAGIRPYEMFSGGEAFRIDFALRIAISKLLARRAGTALQTLIIDEGFGSQDDEGLARLMEAIYSIQSDFAKIIVVSHLNEFKDNFPAHFIVQKGPFGSVVNIEERG